MICTHIQLRGIYFFSLRPCYKADTSPTSKLGDFVARSSTCARGLPRSLSDHGSGTSSLAPRPMLRDCLDHSLTTARGLRRSLLDLCSGTASTTLRPQLEDFASRLHAAGDSHTVGIFFSFRPCYKADNLAFQQARGLHRYDAPTGASRIACTTIGFLTLIEILFLDPGTTCLRHLLPGSGTKWAHFTLR